MTTIRELIESLASRLEVDQERVLSGGLDSPVTILNGRHLWTAGTLHLYEFQLPAGVDVMIDVPVSLIPAEEQGEPTEGILLSRRGDTVLLQTFDAVGTHVPSATLVPDRAGFLSTAAARLMEMATKADAYSLGPSERLVPLLARGDVEAGVPLGSPGSAVLTTVWAEDQGIRRQKIANLIIEQIRLNKRILVVSADHHRADEFVGAVARAMKAAGLSFKTWISRYETALTQQAGGMLIQDLGFEMQMHQFYAKSRAEKASLRRKYDRFRELTPLLAYKTQKQRDLDEVRLLEWRLLTQLSELQAKTKEVDQTLKEYENLPLLKRLGMQAVGKNVESLEVYRALYQQQIKALMEELNVAKQRIDELVPEAALPKDLRPEFEELKEEVARLGGTRKIRELLAAEEDTNRQAFIQNRRLVVTTAGRVINDPLFTRVRFDILIADEAPLIPAAFLMAAAGLVRDRIVLSGDLRDIATAGVWGATGAQVPVVG